MSDGLFAAGTCAEAHEVALTVRSNWKSFLPVRAGSRRSGRSEPKAPRRVRPARWMLCRCEHNGTIGGGQLEYMAIRQGPAGSRQTPTTRSNMPMCRWVRQIGQCCGGRVEVETGLAMTNFGIRAGSARRSRRGGFASTLYIFGEVSVGKGDRGGCGASARARDVVETSCQRTLKVFLPGVERC